MSAHHVIQAFRGAIETLDASEPLVRDAIEQGLIDVAGPNSTKRNASKKAVAAIMAQIAPIRRKAIQGAFKHLRATLPHV